MTDSVLICSIRGVRGTKGAQHLVVAPAGALSGAPSPAAALRPGRLPRLARLLALAHKFDDLLRQGLIADYGTLARLGQVSRARISQILKLVQLAPDIQEQILFWPPILKGRDPLVLRQLLPITQVLDWQRQRSLWHQLCAVIQPGRHQPGRHARRGQKHVRALDGSAGGGPMATAEVSTKPPHQRSPATAPAV